MSLHSFVAAVKSPPVPASLVRLLCAFVCALPDTRSCTGDAFCLGFIEAFICAVRTWHKHTLSPVLPAAPFTHLIMPAKPCKAL